MTLNQGGLYSKSSFKKAFSYYLRRVMTIRSLNALQKDLSIQLKCKRGT